MAAGIVSKTVGDGNGGTFLARFWDETGSGPYIPLSGSMLSTTVTPTVTAGAYTTGMTVGGVQSFTGQPGTGWVQSAQALLASGTYAGQIDLLIFSATPSGSTTTDHAAFVMAAADLGKLQGVIKLTDATLLSGVLASIQALSTGMPYVLAAATIFVVPVVRGSVTFAGTGDFSLTLGVVR